MVYVVTGCLGFIGSTFVARALADGHYVYGIDNETYAAKLTHLDRFHITHRFKYIRNDIATLSELPDVDMIVNFAAETHVDNSIAGSTQFVHSNVLGVQNLLECIRKLPEGSRPLFVHVSTDEVYGDTIDQASPTETSILRPSNPYAATKAAADMLIMSYARTYGIKYKIVRPSNCIGIHQYHEKLIPKYLRYLRMGRKFPIHGSGEQTRSWLYVTDAVDAINFVIQYGGVNTVYNIGGQIHSINDIVKLVHKCYSEEVESDILFEDTVSHGASRPGMDLHYNVDDTRLRQTGWAGDADRGMSIEDVIKSTVQYELLSSPIL